MQQSELFQNFLQKKDRIHKLLNEKQRIIEKKERLKSPLHYETISPKSNLNFRHFQKASQTSHLKTQTNEIYLAHLQQEFKAQLREYVHEEDTYKQSMIQLATIVDDLEADFQEEKTKQNTAKNDLFELQLEKGLYEENSEKLLERVIEIEENLQRADEKFQLIEKEGIRLEESIEYEKCMLKELSNNNNSMIGKLEGESEKVRAQTALLEESEESVRVKQARVNHLNKQNQQILLQLQSQNLQLSNHQGDFELAQCDRDSSLENIGFTKEQLGFQLTKNNALRSSELAEQQDNLETLLNVESDFHYERNRLDLDLKTEKEGIEQEYWKIQKEREHYEENHETVDNLRAYLSILIEKNEMLEQSLEEKIIEDHTIKRIVDSKCIRPVGRKVRRILDEFQVREEEQRKVVKEMLRNEFNPNNQRDDGLIGNRYESMSERQHQKENIFERTVLPVQVQGKASNSKPRSIPFKVRQQIQFMTLPQQVHTLEDNSKNSEKKTMESFYPSGEIRLADESFRNSQFSKTGVTFIDRLTRVEKDQTECINERSVRY